MLCRFETRMAKPDLNCTYRHPVSLPGAGARLAQTVQVHVIARRPGRTADRFFLTYSTPDSPAVPAVNARTNRESFELRQKTVIGFA